MDRDDVGGVLADLERTGTLRRGLGGLATAWAAGRARLDADVVGAVLADRKEGP